MPRFLRAPSWLALEHFSQNMTAGSYSLAQGLDANLHGLWRAAFSLTSKLRGDDDPGHFAGSDNPKDWLKKVHQTTKPDADWWADDELKLFRREDATEWVVFTVAFFALIIFDNWVLHRKNEVLSFGKACGYTFFWICCAGCFNLYVYHQKGYDAALTWATGYLLEWMLSVDNLFVFHLIFKIYGTPEDQMHKPLFYGIVGAIVFRMIFFVLEEALFHSFWWAKVVFGLFLIYTGVQSALVDEEEEDPTQNPVVVALSSMIPMTKRYADDGSFFIKEYDEDDVEQVGPPKCKATLLVAVVLCLEVTDVVFAVDSVSAIVAQVPDLFLAYTACVFAMLGLRAMFFMVNNLIGMFKLLKYGVAVILIFIGMKLLMHSHVHFSTGVVLGMLVGAVAASVVGSMMMEAYGGEGKGMTTDEEHQTKQNRLMSKEGGSRHGSRKASEEATQTSP